MKRNSALICGLILLLGVGGCGGDSRESLTKEGIATMNDLIATLDTVKDEASAKAAKPKLKKLMEQLNELNEKQAKLPAPTEAEMKALGEKYGKQMDEMQRKMAGAMMKMAFDPKIQAELQDIEMKSKGGG